MHDMIIFGCTEQAEIANYYFSKAGYKINYHCVDDEYASSDQFCGVPVIASSEASNKRLWETNKLHVAIGFSNLNRVRQAIFERMKRQGYSFLSYVSDRACVYSKHIGENCFILENNVIQPFVRIGDNAVLWSGNHIGHHTSIEDHVFISSHVVVSGCCKIGGNSFLGVNATISDQVTIGRDNIIGAGCLIKKDTKDAQVFSVPATPPRQISSDRFLKKI